MVCSLAEQPWPEWRLVIDGCCGRLDADHQANVFLAGGWSTPSCLLPVRSSSSHRFDLQWTNLVPVALANDGRWFVVLLWLARARHPTTGCSGDFRFAPVPLSLNRWPEPTCRSDQSASCSTGVAWFHASSRHHVVARRHPAPSFCWPVTTNVLRTFVR